MRIVHAPRRSEVMNAGGIRLLVATLLLPPGAALAADVAVNCDTGGSINAALAALDLQGPHTITVTGTCTENVGVNSRERVTIQASGGTTATVQNGAVPAANVFNINRSRAIALSRLLVRGGAIGIHIGTDSEVTVRDCTVENNANNGINVQGPSSILSLLGSTLRTNGGHGLRVFDNSTAGVGDQPAAQAVLITGNGRSGISVEGASANIRNTTIDNNASTAISVFAGALGAIGRARNIFRNNRGGGIFLVQGSTGFFFADNEIGDNGGVGILVSGSSANFGVPPPADNPGVTVIEGHGQAGLFIRRASDVEMNGGHIVRLNGAGMAPRLSGGIVSTRSSLAVFGGAQITNNTGPGILSDFNNATNVSGANISNNSGDGLTVLRQSVLAFVSPPPTVTGNGGASVACDVTSLVSLNREGFEDIRCARIEPPGHSDMSP